MIAIDTSALAAIYFGENDAERYAAAIAGAGAALLSSATAFEFLLVVARKQGADMTGDAELLLRRPEFEIRAWAPDLVPIALQALRSFGGRPARLNYGDCLAYAFAKSSNLPLLYKGDDFTQTDIVSALA